MWWGRRGDASEDLVVLEILLIALVFLIPLRLLQRRGERQQDRIDSAYERARQVRLSGTGESGARTAIYTDRFYNPS